MKVIFLFFISISILFGTTLSKKEKRDLSKSLKKQHYYITDIKKYNNLLIAVGEDDSKTQECDEDHYSVILKSTDNGKSWKRVNEGDTIVPHLIHIENENTIVVGLSMEGAGGAILVTHDSGKTWRKVYNDAMIETITKEKDLIRVRTLATDVVSKDGGRTWELLPFRQ